MDYMANTFVGKIEQRGINQGRKEGVELAKIEIAWNLLDILSNKQIASRTKLTIEEVAKLREKYISLKED